MLKHNERILPASGLCWSVVEETEDGMTLLETPQNERERQ